MSWRWYGVKTLYRTQAVGRPRNVDAHFDSDCTLIEERVVIFRARSYEEAIQKAENEARSYPLPSYRNIYGQRVVQRYLGTCDAYELFDPPAPSREVFSSTEVVSGSVTNEEIVSRRFGDEMRPNRSARTKFMDAELLREVGSKR
jgi:hypothetical protein